MSFPRLTMDVDLEPLAPNRIHSLPVRVSYLVPPSSQTFSTTFDAPQQVYVHPNPSARSGRDEAWGAIYLKTIVQGILGASPELHPSHASTPDFSLYVHDPRETYLRRSRPSIAPSSDAAVPVPPQEVWTGKGLVSWALDEPGAGKNLITGRLVACESFAAPNKRDDSLSALEALVEQGNVRGKAWGIEVFISMRSNLGRANIFPAALHQSVEARAAPKLDPPEQAAPRPLPLATPHRPSTVAQSSSLSRPILTRPKSFVKKKRSPVQPEPRGRLGALDVNSPRVVSGGPAPTALRADAHPAAAAWNSRSASLLARPEDITQDNAHELLRDQTFLDILARVTGTPVGQIKAAPAPATTSSEPARKRRRKVTDKVEEGIGASRAKTSGWVGAGPGKVPPEELKCYNCATTKSSVWRMKEMEDGKVVRVCNACGLYYNKTRNMRPQSMWGNRADAAESSTFAQTPGAPSAARSRSSGTPSSFKRTFTMAVEKDAERIASRHRAAQSSTPAPYAMSEMNVGDAPTPDSRQMPMTSPVRGLPGQPPRRKRETPVAPPASTPARSTAPPAESPNTIIRRILAGGEAPTLAMPLSDDHTGSSVHAPTSAVAPDLDWASTGLSAFLSVEGFTMPLVTAGPLGTPTAPAHMPTDLQGVSSIMRPPRADDDDDVFSELFQRTSSLGVLSSPSTGAAFDFSQLPPSSPPAMPGLAHSALLLSSPSASPGDTPLADKSPAKPASGLRHSVGAHGADADAVEQSRDYVFDSKFDLDFGMGFDTAFAPVEGAEIEELLKGFATDRAAVDDVDWASWGAIEG
ncbi:hypothetical protein Q5752_003743 [Cryptotrichosporon argae]